MRKGWREYQLEEIPLEILDGDRGKNYPKKSEFHRQGHCLFLNANNVTQNGFDFASDVDFISDEKDKSLRKGKLNRYDVVLTTRGTIGNVAYFGDDIPFEHIRINSGMVILRGNERFFDSYFLYQFFKSSLFRSQIQKLSTGSAVPQLPIRDIKKTRINLPPINEQRRIAAVLKSFDDKIENNRKMNETLEGMAQALFKSWFVDFDPVLDNALAAGNRIPKEFARRVRQRKAIASKHKPLPPEIRALFPSEFQLSEHGPIPKGWEYCTAGDVFDVTMGQSPPGDTYNERGIGIVFFQGRADFGFRYPSNRVFCISPKKLAEKYDTLVSVRAPVGDVNMAREKCCIGRGLASVRHKKSFSFAYYCMKNLQEEFKKFESNGTVFGSISYKEFKALPCLNCNNTFINAFDQIVKSIDKSIERNIDEMNRLMGLRDMLLPKLLSGKIEI